MLYVDGHCIRLFFSHSNWFWSLMIHDNTASCVWAICDIISARSTRNSSVPSKTSLILSTMSLSKDSLVLRQMITILFSNVEHRHFHGLENFWSVRLRIMFLHFHLLTIGIAIKLVPKVDGYLLLSRLCLLHEWTALGIHSIECRASTRIIWILPRLLFMFIFSIMCQKRSLISPKIKSARVCTWWVIYQDVFSYFGYFLLVHLVNFCERSDASEIVDTSIQFGRFRTLVIEILSEDLLVDILANVSVFVLYYWLRQFTWHFR